MEELYEILSSVGVTVGYARVSENTQLPYIVYTDYSEYYTKADNRIDNIVTNVQVDYYTTKRFDPNKAKIRESLDKAGITFSYQMMFDTTERVYHHIFDCEVPE